MEEDGRTRPARRAHLPHGPGRLTALERHLPQRPIALDARAQLGRERIDDARTNAVETTSRLVGALLELSAGVEHGEDHLDRALLRRRVPVDGNAPAVVSDGDRASVGVQGDGDVRGEAVHRLVYCVVQDLPDQVMEPRTSDAPDVHARTLANRLESLEHRDVFGGVGGGHLEGQTVGSGQQAEGRKRLGRRDTLRRYLIVRKPRLPYKCGKASRVRSAALRCRHLAHRADVACGARAVVWIATLSPRLQPRRGHRARPSPEPAPAHVRAR